MPIEIREVSRSQLCELLGIAPERFLGVQTNRGRDRIGILLEPEDGMAQTSGSFPQLTKGGKKSGGKSGKRGC